MGAAFVTNRIDFQQKTNRIDQYMYLNSKIYHSGWTLQWKKFIILHKKKKVYYTLFHLPFSFSCLINSFYFIAKKYKQQLEEITFNYVIALVGEPEKKRHQSGVT